LYLRILHHRGEATLKPFRRIHGYLSASARWAALSASVLWVACGWEATADREPLRVCEDYASAFEACFSRIGSGRDAVAKQVASLRRTFASAPASAASRAQLAVSCTSGLARLQRTCMGSDLSSSSVVATGVTP
jgi:hypothetical protein